MLKCNLHIGLSMFRGPGIAVGYRIKCAWVKHVEFLAPKKKKSSYSTGFL